MSHSSCSSFKRKSEFGDLSALLVTVLLREGLGGGGTFNDLSVKVAPLKSTRSLSVPFTKHTCTHYGWVKMTSTRSSRL